MSDDLVEKLYDRRVCSPAQNSCRNDFVLDQAADCIEQLAATNEELEDKMAKVVAERDEALNQLDSARHSVEVLKKRVAKLKGQDDE